MIEADTQMPIDLAEARKAFQVEPGLYVAVSNEEIEQSLPEPSRETGIDPNSTSWLPDPETSCRIACRVDFARQTPYPKPQWIASYSLQR